MPSQSEKVQTCAITTDQTRFNTLGEMLEFNHEVPDLIINSSALRAKTTAELVAEGCWYKGENRTGRKSLSS